MKVITYHYVRPTSQAKYPEIKHLPLDQFISQLDFLQKNYHIATAEQIIETLTEKKSFLPEKSVFLTFDDGIKDHFEFVFPLLEKRKIQGAFYVPSSVTKGNKILDIHLLHHILAKVEDKFLLVKEMEEWVEQNREQYSLLSLSEYQRIAALNSKYDSREIIYLKKMLQKLLPLELRDAILWHFYNKYLLIDPRSLAESIYLNGSELKTMSENGMHIGSHGHNHFWMNEISQQEMKKEIESSLAFLKELNVPADQYTFCYPHGAYNKELTTLLNKAGFKFALTQGEPNNNFWSYDSLEFPRYDTNDILKEQKIQNEALCSARN